jgi:hypothetical protein
MKMLVLGLEGTLIHVSSSPPQSGVQFVKTGGDLYICKRPGLDDFLRTVRSQFDVFACAESDATPVIDSIIPLASQEASTATRKGTRCVQQIKEAADRGRQLWPDI